MYMFHEIERKGMADRLKKAWEGALKNEDEAIRLRARLAAIDSERKELEEEELLIKRCYRLNGWKGDYSLAGPVEILDCDF